MGYFFVSQVYLFSVFPKPSKMMADQKPTALANDMFSPPQCGYTLIYNCEMHHKKCVLTNKSTKYL